MSNVNAIMYRTKDECKVWMYVLGARKTRGGAYKVQPSIRPPELGNHSRTLLELHQSEPRTYPPSTLQFPSPSTSHRQHMQHSSSPPSLLLSHPLHRQFLPSILFTWSGSSVNTPFTTAFSTTVRFSSSSSPAVSSCFSFATCSPGVSASTYSEDSGDPRASGKLFACGWSDGSDTSDSCGKFPCQEYFPSIFSSQISSTQNLVSILYVPLPIRIQNNVRILNLNRNPIIFHLTPVILWFNY